MFYDPDFWQVLFNTTYFTIATVIPSLVIPLGLAVLLDRSFSINQFALTGYLTYWGHLADYLNWQPLPMRTP